ncbi:MAG: hypothetical protein HQ575_04185 [Candidatus Omnitrophica bacterium]|nr:hypothetical protein [Candidatus Omnitrophota bacterium]
MKKPVQKIIAREGLIIIISYLIGIVCSILCTIKGIELNDVDGFVYIPLFVYLLVLISRFIKWAIRTLKEK